MNAETYSKLREKIKNRDFEVKNKSLNNWFFKSTFLGNIGSIFFAFFLVYPALYKAIDANLIQGNWSTILATVFTILILVIFESVKRKILANLSDDLVTTNWNMKDRGVRWWLILSTVIILGSAFLSVSGAKKFSETSRNRNIQIENVVQVDIDSITNIYNERKNVLIEDNDQIRKDNADLREKIKNTPVGYVNSRKSLQDNINANLAAIDANDAKLIALDNELRNRVEELETEQEEKISKNIRDDTGIILLFILISSVIEFIIVFGIWFRSYFNYNVFLLHEAEFEGIHQKRNRYLTLVDFIYKEGSVEKGEKIIGMVKFKEVVKEKSTIPSSDKLIDDFLLDMEHLGILTMEGKRRFIACSYEEAIKRVEKFDNTLRLLENLE